MILARHLFTNVLVLASVRAGLATERKRSTLPSRTVLLLDDDPDFASAAAEAMRATGLRVLTALHPWDAFQHLDDGGPIDLFLADIRMPAGTPHGFAMGRNAKFRRPSLRLIYVTGYRELAELEAYTSDTVLFKPIHPDRLAQEVNRALAAD